MICSVVGSQRTSSAARALKRAAMSCPVLVLSGSSNDHDWQLEALKVPCVLCGTPVVDLRIEQGTATECYIV